MKAILGLRLIAKSGTSDDQLFNCVPVTPTFQAKNCETRNDIFYW